MKIFDDEVARFFVVPAMGRDDFHCRNLGGKGFDQSIARHLSCDAAKARALTVDQLQGQIRPSDDGVDKAIMTVAAESLAQRDRAEIDALVARR
jgi:hypothetical protein